MAMGSFSAISIVFNGDAYKVMITVPLVGLCSKCCRSFGYISFEMESGLGKHVHR